MRYTEQAGAALDSYVARVRRAVAGRPDIDPDEVVSGIREHVEAALSLRAIDPATAEDVVEVLDQLGSPDTLADDEDARRVTPTTSAATVTAWAAFALATIGIALIPTRLMPVGLALVVIALVASRTVLADEALADTVTGRLAAVFWYLGMVVTVLALVLVPAVLVWASAQTGGVLETSLARFVGVSGTERPGRYWGAMAAVAGAVTGVWWLALAVLVGAGRTGLLRVLGPASLLAPRSSARLLAITGAALIAVSLIAGWLT